MLERQKLRPPGWDGLTKSCCRGDCRLAAASAMQLAFNCGPKTLFQAIEIALARRDFELSPVNRTAHFWAHDDDAVDDDGDLFVVVRGRHVVQRRGLGLIELDAEDLNPIGPGLEHRLSGKIQRYIGSVCQDEEIRGDSFRRNRDGALVWAKCWRRLLAGTMASDGVSAVGKAWRRARGTRRLAEHLSDDDHQDHTGENGGAHRVTSCDVEKIVKAANDSGGYPIIDPARPGSRWGVAAKELVASQREFGRAASINLRGTCTKMSSTLRVVEM